MAICHRQGGRLLWSKGRTKFSKWPPSGMLRQARCLSALLETCRNIQGIPSAKTPVSAFAISRIAQIAAVHLKTQAQTDLDVARREARRGSGDLAKDGIAQIGIRPSELGAICGIEKLAAKLGPQSLRYLKILG